MNKLTITYIIFGILFIVLALTIFFLRVPQTCYAGCHITPPFMNGPKCVSVQEKYLDKTIVKPTPQPYLIRFSNVKGAGYPFCKPVWYAFRYVRNSDGGYGPLSKWAGMDTSMNSPLAIYAGATALPCAHPEGYLEPNCQKWGIALGYQSCTSNEPVIGLTDPLDINVKYCQPDGYTLNVHRQIGGFSGDQPIGFDENSEEEIVGSFIVNIGQGDDYIKATFYDALFNPNVTTNDTCCGE